MGFDFRERCPVPESSPDAWWLDTLGLKLSFFPKLVLKLSFVFDFCPDVSNCPGIGTARCLSSLCQQHQSAHTHQSQQMSPLQELKTEGI